MALYHPQDLFDMEIVKPEREPWLAKLRRHRNAIMLAAIAGALLGEIACNLMPATYRATGRLLIVPVEDPTASTTSSAIEAANATLPVVVAVLRSRRVADETIEQLKLDGAWRMPPADARKQLIDRLSVSTDRKANLLTVSFEDARPDRARAVVAAVADKAAMLSKELWAQRNREHRQRLEKDLAEVGATLSAAEDKFREFREKNHVIDLPAQIKATVEQAAALEKLRIEKGLDLRFARAFGNHASVEVQTGVEERAAASGALESLKHGGGVGPLLPLDQLPRLELEHARLKRAVDEQGARHELLALKVGQLLAAEARPGGLAEVIDPPSEPRAPAGPSIGKLVLAGTGGGALLGVILVLGLARREEEAVDDA